MAAIEGGELGLTEALDDGQDGGVDEADVGVRVAFDDLVDAVVILREEVFNMEVAAADIRQEGETSLIPQYLSRPVINFDQDWRRNHQ